MKKIVSVIGQSMSTPDQDDRAFELGKLLSDEGCVIVCGGGGGVMEAVAKGAAERDGICIGLLPGHDNVEANPYLTVAIPTGLGHARNLLVSYAGDVVVAVGGGYGTLSEIAFALTIGKVVIGMGTWEAVSHNGTRAQVIEVQTPEEAVEQIKKILTLDS